MSLVFLFGITCPLTLALRGSWLESQFDRLRKLRDVRFLTNPPGRWLVVPSITASPLPWPRSLPATKTSNLSSG